jgi:hypothetical protein
MIIVYRLDTLIVSSIYQIIPYINNISAPNNLILNAASLLNSQEIITLIDTALNTTSSWVLNLYPVL